MDHLPQGTIVGDINRRKGVIQNTETEGDDVVIQAHVPVNMMFGYSTSLRSMTQGKGEFTMEYLEHLAVPRVCVLTAHSSPAAGL